MSDETEQRERLARTLVARGLVTDAELRLCRVFEDDLSIKRMVRRLVKAGFLTSNQSQRVLEDWPSETEQRIPGYHLLEKIGRGSVGEVYRAEQVSMRREVAVKILHERLAENASYVARFQREAHLAAKLSHNNIVQAIDVGSAGSLHYFVMELVAGETIADKIRAGKIYAEREALKIVAQIARALDHAHRRGLIHRDIKPANIVLTQDGIAKLADLGMARQTNDLRLARRERGRMIGTPYYMAPEQVQGREDIDEQADLYSLGATFYHMVTGQPPYPGDELEPVLEGHLHGELTPPDHINQQLTGGLGEVVEWLLAKKRKDRYRSAADLLIDLECLLEGKAPRLARSKIEAITLQGLAEGEAIDDEDELEPQTVAVSQTWLLILATLLGISVLVNLVLLLR